MNLVLLSIWQIAFLVFFQSFQANPAGHIKLVV